MVASTCKVMFGSWKNWGKMQMKENRGKKWKIKNKFKLLQTQLTYFNLLI